MNAPAKIGYDGERPEFQVSRDLQGNGKREAVDGPTNVRVDKLEWLLAHKSIDLIQHTAGRRLQRDYELAQIMTFSTFEGGAGRGPGTNLSDVKLDAMTRHGAAHAFVGNLGSLILRLVVEENKSLEKAASLMRQNPRGMLLPLRMALDALGRFYDRMGYDEK